MEIRYVKKAGIIEEKIPMVMQSVPKKLDTPQMLLVIRYELNDCLIMTKSSPQHSIMNSLIYVRTGECHGSFKTPPRIWVYA